jgi:ubiquinone/menaquinone biosynthesis C-methylase UbiE
MGTGIAYDDYEAKFSLPEQEGNRPVIKNVYRMAAGRLVHHLEAGREDTILDLGSGTGISALELLVRNPGISVVGVEKSSGMLEVARYKFHHDLGEVLREHVGDCALLRYWEAFRRESAEYENMVTFYEGDIQDMQFLDDNSVDHAIGNQVIHWTDLSRSFRELGRVLGGGGTVVWNSSSHFYDDHRFPSSKFGFRYNDFLRYVLEDISETKGVRNVGDYRKMSVPGHTLESIQEITVQHGFETEQIALHLLPVDLQTFSRVHVPMFAKELVNHDLSDNEFDACVKESISRTIVNPRALMDVTHKYDTNPIFRSVKI